MPMSRFEDVPIHGDFPVINEGDMAVDFALVHGEGSSAGVEKFTFMPRNDKLNVTEDDMPDVVRDHPGRQRVMYGVLVGKGAVNEHTGEFPGSSDYIESMTATHGSGHSYTYKLKRAEAEFGLGNSEPGHLVVGDVGLSFYPKETHPKAEAVAVVSGVVLALGGISAVIRRKRDRSA